VARYVNAVVALLVTSSVLAGVAGGVPAETLADERAPDSTERDAEGTASTAAIAAVYPNPVADGDRGEFVVIRLPDRRSGTLSVSDGETTIRLPNETAGRSVAITGSPRLVRNLTDRPVIGVADGLSLSNSGERVVLRRGDERVDAVRYTDAPEGEVGTVGAGGRLDWRPIGATERPAVTARGGRVRAFVLPDAPAVPVEPLRGAENRIMLAGYTLTSERVARALARAAERGVDVRVLLEGEPVGGISRRQARVLDRLVAAGVSVRLIAGPRARYDYHHAKYAVVDDRAVVLTENWKRAGTGGQSSRGWGVVVSEPSIVTGLADTFRADAGWHDARPWQSFREGRTFERAGVANGSYPARVEPQTVPVNRTTLLVAPDNAERAILRELRRANESIDVIQMSIGGRDQAFLRAVLRAAERGVRVRLLLSSAWYVEEDNRRLAEELRAYADRRDLPLSARLASPAGRFEKVHAKGAVVDGETVVLGSLNWNDAASQSNREVVLLLEGKQVADYYGRVFEADWASDRGGPALPVGLLAGLAGSLVLVAIAARRISFDDDIGVGVDLDEPEP
jgi:hypothetical protein